jgi:hypothetical protein
MATPKPEFKLKLDFSSLLGPLFYMWVVQMLLPIFLLQLVYEKEKRLRMMMKMHGLGDRAYWAITYAWDLLLYVAYMLIFILFGSGIGLAIFRKNSYAVQVRAFWGPGRQGRGRGGGPGAGRLKGRCDQPPCPPAAPRRRPCWHSCCRLGSCPPCTPAPAPWPAQIAFYFVFGNNMIAFAFLLSCLFSSNRTAVVFAFLWVFGTGLIGDLLLSNFIASDRWFMVLIELVPAFSLYR